MMTCTTPTCTYVYGVGVCVIHVLHVCATLNRHQVLPLSQHDALQQVHGYTVLQCC